MMIQPKPRISELMKNGHCIAIAIRRPPGSFVRTTTTAIGMAITRVSTVVRVAKRKVFHTTRPKPASVNRSTYPSRVNTPPSSYSGTDRIDWTRVGTIGASTNNARPSSTA
jgi:hypothetical protein